MQTPALPDRSLEYRLPELVQAAAVLLARSGVAPTDERVAARPDARVVRYYQSLGLVEKPLRYEGRAAIYGWRQLVQVVAVKLLQQQGSSLAQIQTAFAGLPFSRLEASVLSAVGGSAARPKPPPAPRSLVTVELAPGVTVTVDPAVVAEPMALITQLQLALHPGGSP